MTTTLLAVDDSKTMRKVLDITFAGEEEYRAVLANSADDALAKVRAEKPNIVLVDAALQGTSGYELCQKIKAEAPGTGVILLSSKQQPYERGRGASVGVDDFIDKPFDTQQLIDKVGVVLKQAAAAPAPAPAPAAVRPVAPAMPQPGTPSSGEPRARVQTLAYGASASKSIPLATTARPAAAAARQNSPTQGGMGSAMPPIVPSARPLAASTGGSVAIKSPPEAAPQPAAEPKKPAVPVPAAVVAASAVATASATAVPVAPVPADLEGKLLGLGLTGDQVRGVLLISKDVLEQAVWEIVPVLAETMIREELERLTKE